MEDTHQEQRMTIAETAGRRIAAPSIDVLEAIRTRRSVRGFTSESVPRETIEAILRLASNAPSGSNIQPWRVLVCTGAVRDRLVKALHAAADRGEGREGEYAYYPAQWSEPYLGRRRKLGWDLYGLLGIGRGDIVGMQGHEKNNLAFFGAPVGLMFTLERQMEKGSWLDLGMFMQNVMLAARAFGLDTCPQQIFAQYHRTVCQELAIPEDEILVCGMALGHIDPDAPANALAVERAPLEDYARFVGW